MNTPNKLTLMRVILVPVFLFLFLMDMIPGHYIAAFLVFVIASVTDFLDGYLARKHNLVTTFGKFLDPLADKMLVTVALLCLMEVGLCPTVAVAIIILRDTAVNALRLLAASEEGMVIAAAQSGRIKTATQMVVTSILLGVLGISDFIPAVNSSLFSMLANIACWILAAITLYSGIEYLYKNRHVFLKSK